MATIQNTTYKMEIPPRNSIVHRSGNQIGIGAALPAGFLQNQFRATPAGSATVGNMSFKEYLRSLQAEELPNEKTTHTALIALKATIGTIYHSKVPLQILFQLGKELLNNIPITSIVSLLRL